MTYVWLSENGRHRYVDDQWLNPCRKCGERISVCQANACTGCEYCGDAHATDTCPDKIAKESEERDCQDCNHTPCGCDILRESYKDANL